MKTASTTPLRYLCALAGGALPVIAMVAPLSAAQAGEPASSCTNAISILNEGRNFDAFDKQNGGGEKRLRFRLDGKEPCAGGGCRRENTAEATAAGADASKPETRAQGRPETGAATKIEVVAGAAAAERVIATIDLAGRTASYCVYELSRVDARPEPHQKGCPRNWLRNFLAIKLVDGDGPFARRDISIQYLYRADAGAASLESCMTPAILDGMFRRRAWTVPMEGAAAFIGEMDFPRDRRAPVPREPPYAATVFGAKPE